MKKLLLTICFILITSQAWAATRYVRTDGGTGTQCTGLVDDDQPTAVGTACALKHPFWVLPPRNGDTSRAAVAGDTVVIKSGSYRIGCQNSTQCWDNNVNLPSNWCNSSTPYDCWMQEIPDNITITGCTTTGCGCTAAKNASGIWVSTCTTTLPELWGAGRINEGIININNSNGVTVRDLNITDHETCGNGHPTIKCGDSSDSAELTANTGVSVNGASNFTLKNLKIHGLYNSGIRGAPALSGGTILVDNVESSGNGMAGWDLDTCVAGEGTCGTNGNITFQNGWKFNWNGCIEVNPGYGTMVAGGCHGGENSGYGDGIGASDTGGNWTFIDGESLFNYSDGIDLIYHNRTSHFNYAKGTIVAKRIHTEGNMGCGFKSDNVVTVEDSSLIGNCGYFKGKSIECASSHGCGNAPRYCRGNAAWGIEFHSPNADSPKLINSTILSNFDTTIGTSQVCPSGTPVYVYNSILVGGRDFIQDSGIFSGGADDFSGVFYNSCLYGDCTGPGDTCWAVLTPTNTLCYSFKEGTSACPGATNTSAVAIPSTLFSGTIKQGPNSSPGYYTASDYVMQILLGASSAARGLSDETVSGADALDENSFNRGAAWDAGAFEYGTTGGSGGSTCPNNIREGSEICDGTDLNSQTCVTQGFSSGTLTCNANCQAFVTTSCVAATCGDSNVDAGEQCDTANLNGQTCSSQGFSSGTLACNGSCQFNTSGCVSPVCGNGTLDSGEECDDSNTTNSDGCSSICETEVAPYEKLLLYTETDASAKLTVKTHKVTMTGLGRDVAAKVYKDGGAAHYATGLHHRFKVQVNACNDNGSAGADVHLWGLSSTLRTSGAEMDSAGDGISFVLYCESSSSNYEFGLVDHTATPEESFIVGSPPVITRYVDILWSGSTITAKLYSDVNYMTQVGTTMTVNNSGSFRYLYFPLAFNDGTTGTSISAVVENLDLNESTGTTCGSNGCESGETCSSCPGDCGSCAACPDGSCNGVETCSTCPADCGSCSGGGTPTAGGCRGGARLRGGAITR